MSTTAFGYESQKIILQYMDANSRIQFSLRCPAIRVTEKLIPLPIDHLSFGRMRTQINDTRYELGVYRHYPEGATIPEDHLFANESGGTELDLTRCGMENYGSANEMLPGDVDLYRGVRDVPTVEEELAYHVECEKALRDLQQILNDVNPGVDDYATRVKVLENRIDHLNELLQPYRCTMKNTPSQFECFIQLTISSLRGKTIERVQYTQKLPNALKYLNSALLGGRRDIQVNKLTLNNSQYIYRFPIGLKLQAKTIQSELIEYHLLDHIIDPSSYPTIDLVITNSPQTPDLYNQPAIRNAKSLSIDNEYFVADEEWYMAMRSLETKEVTFRNEMGQALYTRLGKFWMQSGKPIGTVYKFGLQRLTATNTYNEEERAAIFPMPDGNSELRIYHERIVPPPKNHNGSFFYMVMKVVGI